MRRQQGVALVVALLAVALAMVLVMSLLDRGELTQARTSNTWRAEQSWQLLQGLEAMAQERLLADQRSSGPIDSLDEEWVKPMPPIRLPGAVLRGRMADLGGCFNINSLAPGGATDARAVARFVRLLHALHLPAEIATQAADDIDADSAVQPGGGEDAAYAVWPQLSRAANAPFADIGELRRVPAMSAEAWQALAPWICAVPADQPLNLNTAPAMLWLTLDDAITLPIAQQLSRGDGAAYPDLAAVRTALSRQGFPNVDLTGYGVDSRYFLAEADISVDGIDFSYSSVLHRLPDQVRVVARTRGHGWMPSGEANE